MNANSMSMRMTLRPLQMLGVLLAAQLALAGAVAWWQVRTPGDAAPSALFSFDAQAIDRVLIEGPDKKRVELKRTGGRDAAWVVAEAGDFPADGARVRQLIDKLHGLKAGDPIATRAEAAERFRVADAAFERRVQADAGGKAQATLLLGSSQGARGTYARKAGDSAVLGVDWPTHDLGTRADDWLDKTVLRVPREQIEAIEVGGVRLLAGAAPQATAPGAGATAAAASATTPGAASSPGSAASAAPPRWSASGLAAGQTLDEAAAERLAQAIGDLAFQGLRGLDATARQGLGAPELRLRVQRRGGAPVDYTLFKAAGSEDRVLVVSNRPEAFTLAAHQARPLIDAARPSALAH